MKYVKCKVGPISYLHSCGTSLPNNYLTASNICFEHKSRGRSNAEPIFSKPFRSLLYALFLSLDASHLLLLALTALLTDTPLLFPLLLRSFFNTLAPRLLPLAPAGLTAADAPVCAVTAPPATVVLAPLAPSFSPELELLEGGRGQRRLRRT